jgi:hypothetical protein
VVTANHMLPNVGLLNGGVISGHQSVAEADLPLDSIGPLPVAAAPNGSISEAASALCDIRART